MAIDVFMVHHLFHSIGATNIFKDGSSNPHRCNICDFNLFVLLRNKPMCVTTDLITRTVGGVVMQTLYDKENANKKWFAWVIQKISCRGGDTLLQIKYDEDGVTEIELAGGSKQQEQSKHPWLEIQ